MLYGTEYYRLNPACHCTLRGKNAVRENGSLLLAYARPALWDTHWRSSRLALSESPWGTSRRACPDILLIGMFRPALPSGKANKWNEGETRLLAAGTQDSFLNLHIRMIRTTV